MSRRSALVKLLIDLFEPEELRAFLHAGPDGERLVSELPSKYDSEANIVEEACGLLDGHGLLDDGFFRRLAEEKPDALVAIEAVRKLFPGTTPLIDREPWWRLAVRGLDRRYLGRAFGALVLAGTVLAVGTRIDTALAWMLLGRAHGELDPKRTLVVLVSARPTVREERLDLAALVARLTQVGVTAIAVDGTFAASDPEGDAALIPALEAARRAGIRVIVGAEWVEGGGAPPPATRGIADNTELAHIEIEPVTPGWLPLADVRVRKRTAEGDLWGLSVQALRATAAGFPPPIVTATSLNVADRVSCAAAGRVTSHPVGAIPTVTWPDAAQSLASYHDYTVFVGEDRPGDQYAFRDRTLPGVAVHAGLYVTLREQAAPCRGGKGWNAGLALLAGGATVGARLRKRVAGVAAVVAGVALVAGYLGMIAGGTLPSAAGALAAAVLAGAWPASTRGQ